jgi:uncharacterized phosphatase
VSTELPYGRDFRMVRHAETEDNKNGVVSGKISKTTLTEEGKRQAVKAQEIIIKLDPPVSQIITSEMQRTIDTAKLLSDNDSLRHLLHSTHSGINERHYGKAEGMSDIERDKIKKSGGKIEGEEPKDIQRNRTIMAIAESLKRYDGAPLFVTHGGNIRRVLEATLGENVARREHATNCTIYEFISPKGKGERWKVNVLELDSNKDIYRRPFGEGKSQAGRLTTRRNEVHIGNTL